MDGLSIQFTAQQHAHGIVVDKVVSSAFSQK